MTTEMLTHGASNAARYVQSATQEQLHRLQELNVFQIGGTVREELAEVWLQCRDPNWDGFGALPIENETLWNAYRFLESLPLGVPAPSIGAEPDGSLTVEWHRSPRRTLSISVSPDGDLHYAAHFGPSRVFGTEAFFGELPPNILDLVRRVYAA